MDPIKLKPQQAPFTMPAQFHLWVECKEAFAPLHVFRVHLECDGLKRTLESKAFNPRSQQAAATAWLEFMSLVGNIIITSVMPPDMLARFQPTSGGGMRLLNQEGENE